MVQDIIFFCDGSKPKLYMYTYKTEVHFLEELLHLVHCLTEFRMAEVSTVKAISSVVVVCWVK